MLVNQAKGLISPLFSMMPVSPSEISGRWLSSELNPQDAIGSLAITHRGDACHLQRPICEELVESGETLPVSKSGTVPSLTFDFAPRRIRGQSGSPLAGRHCSRASLITDNTSLAFSSRRYAFWRGAILGCRKPFLPRLFFSNAAAALCFSLPSAPHSIVGGETAVTLRVGQRWSAFDSEDNSSVLKRLAHGSYVMGTRLPNAILKIADRHFAKIGLCAKSHARPVQQGSCCS